MPLAVTRTWLHHWDKPIGLLLLCPIADMSSLLRTTNIQGAFRLLYILCRKMVASCKRSAVTNVSMPFPCSVPLEKRSFFAATATMAEPAIRISLSPIGKNDVDQKILIVKR